MSGGENLFELVAIVKCDPLNMGAGGVESKDQGTLLFIYPGGRVRAMGRK